MADKTNRTALILGATGGVGGATAAALIAQGWQVRALVRDRAAAERGWSYGAPRPRWIAGDAMRGHDVLAAAIGADAIVHAVNPPGYRGWDRQVLPMLENSIAAAAATGARLMLPGTIYNYDPLSQPVVDEYTVQRGQGHKARLRIAMEAMLERAAAERGVRSLIVRAGDFFGPGARQSWFAQAMVRPGRPLRHTVTPGREAVGHSWAYLPDLAAAIARLLGAEDRLMRCERVHFHGHWDFDGRQMVAALAEVSGRPGAGAWRFPWWLTTLAAPFSETMAEMREIRPYWHNPMHLTGTRLGALIGVEPRTPLLSAVHASLAALGCLGEGDAILPPSSRRQPGSLFPDPVLKEQARSWLSPG